VIRDLANLLGDLSDRRIALMETNAYGSNMLWFERPSSGAAAASGLCEVGASPYTM
jgi:hypothetical protein